MAIPGSVSSSPSKLCPCIRFKLQDLILELDNKGIEWKLIETMRDIERQKYYVSIKVSKTLKSKHLPQKPMGLSLAFDIAPKAYLSLKHWNPNGKLWETMRIIGRKLGLTCNIPWDKPHYELSKCECLEE